ncbi:reverse transcriptase domain-containing protein [Cupriavidus necator]
MVSFDSIPHLPLLARVAGRIADGPVLELIQSFLKQDIMEDMTSWTPTSCSPQGAVVSPLLANLYLHELDVEMRQAGLVMVRYADDAVVLCRTREEAEAALTRMRAWVDANGLTLHPDKTHVGDCRLEGHGFEFLGYRFEAGQRWVRKKSLMGLRDKIRALIKRNRGDSIESIIASINPILRGWFGYFRPPLHLLVGRRLCSSPSASALAPTASSSGAGSLPSRSHPMAKCLLR